MKKKKKNNKKNNQRLMFQTILLLISFILVSISGYLYLTKYTNFMSQGLSLIEGKEQLIDNYLMLMLSAGLIIFGIFLFTSKKSLEILWMFFIDFLMLISSALLILGLFVPYKIEFRAGLIISAFIIYFTSYIAKDSIPKIIKNLKKSK